MKRVLYFVLLAGTLLAGSPTPTSAADESKQKPLPPIPLSVNESWHGSTGLTPY